MNTKFVKSKNSWISSLKIRDKYVALSNLSIYYTQKKFNKSYKNNKFEISSPTWNEQFELTGESYSISDIQDYFEYISKKKKNQKKTNNSSIRICVNKIENGIIFKIETGYCL